MAEEQSYSVEVRARWGDIDQAPISPTNQLLAQVNSGEVFLTFGLVMPPAVLGTPEERREQVEAIAKSGAVPVQTVARVFMTADRLREMVGVLNAALTQHEAQQGANAGEATEPDQ